MARRMRTAAEMYPLVEAYLAREGTKKAFCEEHHVPESVLTYWTTKYHRTRSADVGSFIEISPGMALENTPVVEVLFPHGVRLRLFAPASAAYLEQLVAFGRPAA